jgi:precorrin-6B methylase 2
MDLFDAELEYWANKWKNQMLLNIQARGNLDCTQYWNSKESALEFDKLVKEDKWKKGTQKIDQMGILPSDRVLDVGADTGALAIPLSRRVQEITAVEPSETMLWCLQQNIENEKMKNITVIQKRWETICVEKDLKAPYDIVIASYSLGMIDIVDALMKMNKVASRAVYIFWFAENIESNDSFLGLVNQNGFYAAKPQSNVLFNILCILGFNPNMKVHVTTSQSRFKTLDEAVAKKASEFNLTDKKAEDFVRAHLEKTLIFENDCLLLNEAHTDAVIWWKPER